MRAAHGLALFMLAGAPLAEADDLLDVQGRSIVVRPQTRIIVDGEELPPGSPVPQKPGLRVEVYQNAFTGERGAGGAAAAVVFSYAVKGPVTSTAPLSVLGQEVTVDAETQTVGLPGGSIDNVQLGDFLDVSGYIDTNASLRASFIEFSPTPLARWLLSGYISGVGPGERAQVGPQAISLTGVTADDCDPGLAVGQFVEIRADGIDGFVPGDTLDSITRLTCVEPVPIGTPDASGALNGIVGEILSPQTFMFGPYVVSHDAQTEFRFGNAEDIVTGATVEIDGVFGQPPGFTAQGIQFDAPPIRFEGPVEPGDIQPGADGSVLILGNLVRRSGQLRDEDGVYANGITTAQQVEVRGYLDRNGNRFATRARLRGAPDPNDSRAGGPLDSVARPLVEVLGLTLDTTGATFEDPAELPITADEFFAQANPGAIVEQSGSYHAATAMITGGVMALIAPVEPAPPGGLIPDLLVGTLRSTDRLFADGFD